MTRRDLLAEIRALEHCHAYNRREFLLNTDYDPFAFLLRFKTQKGSWKGCLNTSKNNILGYNIGGVFTVMQMVYLGDRTETIAGSAAKRDSITQLNTIKSCF